MKDLEQHIKRITDKVLRLSREQEQLRKENERLKQELFNIVAREKEKDAYVELLTLRIDVLKAAKGEMDSAERKAFEKKISQYLREIDKCIQSLDE